MCFMLCVCCSAYSQGSSNQGKEFWTGFMLHIEPAGIDGSKMNVYITGEVATEGKVEIADGSFSIPFTVTPRQVTVVEIPRSAYLNKQGKFLKGLHIIAAKKVAVYAHIYYRSVSGATLLLPVNVMGKSYYSINYRQQSNSKDSYSTFMVIATEDNTTVEIIPSTNLRDNSRAGVPFTINLQKGEVYQGLSDFDLTNTTIRSVSTKTGECKKIAVFSGSSKIGIGCSEQPAPGQFSSDNLFQQVYPTSSWGKTYITVPLKKRNYDIFRVVFSKPDTKLLINGVRVNAEDQTYYEFESSTPNTITADQPIQVAQYAVTQGQVRDSCIYDSKDLGDPEMIFLTPLEQTLDHVTLYSPPYANITNSYINVVIKQSAVSTFLVDGKPVQGFLPVPADPGYAYAQIAVQSGTHNISAAEGFNAIAYGYGNFESYGYAAGANLSNLNEFIALGDKAGARLAVNGCSGIEYKLQLTIPYQTTNIRWDLSINNSVEVDNNPVVTSTRQLNGKTLYTYEYRKLVSFEAGDYRVTATVLNPLADECGSTADIDFDFNIADYPVANFKVSGTCPGEPVSFQDLTDTKGTDIRSWLWDFGDGTTSNEQNPVHIYSNEGTYKATLTAFNQNDCSSSKDVTLQLYKKPQAAFTASVPACLDGVTFTDKSTIQTGVINQRIWDFGDGTPLETRLDNKPFVHVYAQPGNYSVKLIAVSQSDCSSIAAEQTLTVNPSPVVDFVLPDICLEDGIAYFTDKSTIADNSGAGFKYAWNFGDAANPGTNTSNQKDPNHRYTAVGNYLITLTITSASGCISTKTATLTVNGAIPQARFTVQNASNLCSANEVVIKDESQPLFGSVIKVVWYFDYKNNPQASEVFTRGNMPADRVFTHQYDVFNSPATKTYTVRIEAYSGQTCVAALEKDIVIKANPIVSLVQVPPICNLASPVQITVNKNGYTGTGLFTGDGVSNSGMFDPGKAGVGVHTISYTFTAQNGCDFTITQTIDVKPNPTVDAGTDFTMLEGDTRILKPTANGNGISYKWSPATGLDRDDVLNPAASPTENIRYVLTVTNAEGCSTSDEIFISVLKKPVVVNTFTPNGDGINDTWGIKYLETYPGNTVNIYNRYGEKVYSSIGYASPWDGRSNGAVLPSGTYYYIIDPKNGRKPVSGNVTIIR